MAEILVSNFQSMHKQILQLLLTSYDILIFDWDQKLFKQTSYLNASIIFLANINNRRHINGLDLLQNAFKEVVLKRLRSFQYTLSYETPQN